GAPPQGKHSDQAKGLEHVRYEHRHLSPDAVGDPTPEDASGPIGESAQGHGPGESGTEFETVCHLTSVGRKHEATHRDHDKGDMQQIKVGSLQHFDAVELLSSAAKAR